MLLLPCSLHAQIWGHITPLAPPVYDTVTVRVIGDVMLHQAQIKDASRNGGFDFSPFLDSIAMDLRSADVAIANMEFTLAGKPYTGYPAFSAPDNYAAYVADCGVDVFLTANNHIMDKGLRGLERTFSVYDTMSVAYTRGNPLIVNAGGVRLGIINFTYGTNNPQGESGGPGLHIPLMAERDVLKKAVVQARERGADFVVAFPHWGEEYKLRHGASQEKMAAFLVECGVDAIIGAHPHCVQDFGEMNGVPVYYSLGNAVSNMSAVNTQLELMVTLRFVKGSDFTLRMIEPEHEFLWCSRPGGLSDSFCVIKVRDFLGRRGEWRNFSDYDRMVSTYDRILVTSRQ